MTKTQLTRARQFMHARPDMHVQAADARSRIGESWDVKGVFGRCVLILAGTQGVIAPTYASRGLPMPHSPQPPHAVQSCNKPHPYVGMWVTGDGHIRQELLQSGRYDEARGNRAHAYEGRYEVKGSHIDYWDDTGFTADGEFVTMDELHHAGMVFYRER